MSNTRPLLVDSPKPIEGESVDQFAELREEVEELRGELTTLRQNYERDRAVWSGILRTFQSAFGGQGAPASEPSTGAPTPPNEAAWRMWKDRLPQGCGRIIDALLVQPLTMTQMIRACGMAYGTIKNNMAILKNNALVDKEGERWKLKRL